MIGIARNVSQTPAWTPIDRARPYNWRLIDLRWLTVPSTYPLDHWARDRGCHGVAVCFDSRCEGGGLDAGGRGNPRIDACLVLREVHRVEPVQDVAGRDFIPATFTIRLKAQRAIPAWLTAAAKD